MMYNAGSGTIPMGKAGSMTCTWVNGLAEGPGSFQYATGERWMGHYRGGVAWEGQGVLISKEGVRQEGQWRDGQLVVV